MHAAQPAEVGVEAVCPRMEEHTSETSTSPGVSRHISIDKARPPPSESACSHHEDDAASSEGWGGCSTPCFDDMEPLVDVVVRVRNTFVDLAPAGAPCTQSLRRATSTPALP